MKSGSRPRIEGCRGFHRWLQSPKDPRAVGDWRFHRWYDAGWVMNLIKADMDGDGDLDVLADRRSRTPGVLWLENPGVAAMRSRATLGDAPCGCDWPRGDVYHALYSQTVGGSQGERKNHRIYAAVRPNRIEVLRPGKDVKQPWDEEVITYSLDRFGTAKAARAADLDQDGQLKSPSAARRTGDKSGVFYLKQMDGKWEPHDIGGPKLNMTY